MARLTSRERARVVLGVSVVVTVLLYLVPYGHLLAYPLVLLSTLAHEMGHGLTAVLVGGDFHRFLMWPDASGVAVWGGDVDRLTLGAVAAGGLVGPAVAAALGFWAGRTERGARNALLVTGIFLAIVLVLLVRNLFGALFVGLLAAACLGLASRATPDVCRLVLVFLAVQLALSVFSRADYLFTPTAVTSGGVMPSDTGQMAQALFLPYWFWGIVCGAVSVVVLGYGFRAYWR